MAEEKIDSAKKFRLKKFIKELESPRGRHTELVSVYIPQGYDMNKVINHLAQEEGTASNIKSTSTRKNVIDALERMIQHLKLYSGTPPHGMAVFAGNIAEREGDSNVKVWSIEPPLPLKIRVYRCEKSFLLEPLLDMIATKESYGLVVMDRREATISMLKGKSIIPLAKTHSMVPGKFKAGGQSAMRFLRLREGAAKDFYKKVAEYMKEQFLGKDLKGIIVGGPGPTKYELVEGNYITNDVKKKIIAIKDITYTDDFGVRELVEKSQDVLAEEEIIDEKNTMKKFFEGLIKTQGKVSYGKEQVWANLSGGVVDTLIISETLPDEEIEKLEDEAEKFGTTVKIISVETNEGVQLREMGCYAALLRYEMS
ncbi:MAG: peptide chain release factor aRF-1 [Candidatus Woesearchaeota archaeon]|nr:peptide chain release factor aRF-1 [Candidatus Woesearchaeota archaeon]